MPSGLFALLDDVATITKMAAASIDDVSAAAAKASTKAAGVVIDDTAVTPRYLIGFSPERELPIIAKIARGSLKNKLLFILPAALALSALLPAAITPILMLGGAFLCFEGAEKVIEKLFHAEGHGKSLEEEVEELTAEEHEARMVGGAIRTDFILSAEIMAIALAEVADETLGMRAAILGVVALAITVGVYGLVALIVKMDDIGLHLARRQSSIASAVGRGLVHFMPKLLGFLSVVGTAAMVWVGGGIILHGLEEFGLGALPHAVHHAAEVVGQAVPFAQGVVEWVVNATGAGIFGLAIGAVIAFAHHRIVAARAPKAEA